MSRAQTFPLRFGIDITTPLVGIRPGTAYQAINYEINPNGGYTRVDGFERFDGQPSPSAGADLAERELRRAAINPVPGQGPVRGVFFFNGVVFAMRDDIGGETKTLYRSTPAGWVPVVTPVLTGGGRLETIQANFYASDELERVYGVDGRNLPFEFDGITYTPINTGMTSVENVFPTHLCEFKNHLFLGYPNGSLINSGVGLPLDYTALSGAAEIGVGDRIFALINLKGGALGVFCKDKIQLLTGTSAANFQLQDFSFSGVREWTVQPFFQDAIFLDKQLQRMGSSDQFGDFQAGSLSEPIRPIIQASLLTSDLSLALPTKNQYLLFQSGRRIVVCTFDEQNRPAFTTMLTPVEFVCGNRYEDLQGRDKVFLGASNGFVYEFNVGLSFDGEPIDSLLQLAPIHPQGFNVNKRFRKVTLESNSGFEGMLCHAEFDYAQGPSSLQVPQDAPLLASLYDVDNWDEAYWSGGLRNYSEIYLEGHGRNISVYLFHRSATEIPFTLDLMTINYDIRRLVR